MHLMKKQQLECTFKTLTNVGRKIFYKDARPKKTTLTSYRKDDDGHGSNSFYATVRLNFHCIHSHQNYNTIKTYSTAQHAQKTCKQH